MSSDRRSFLNLAAATAAVLTAPAAVAGHHAGGWRADGKPWLLAAPEPVVVPTLSYGPEALMPHISPETISFHFGKHHVGYHTRLVALLGDKVASYDLPTLVRLSAKGEGGLTREVFNNAAQIWNHNFYWRGLRPVGAPESANEPRGALKAAIDRQFGGVDKLLAQIQRDATSLFGSGWVWLSMDQQGRLSLQSTSNADTPLTDGLRPLWVIDVWEHAYYVDQRNKRAAHVAAVLKHLINWDFVEANYLL